jgi:hypothetical protein
VTTWNPIVFWCEWWAILTVIERVAAVVFLVSVIAILFVLPAWAADSITAVEINAIMATVFAGLAAIISAIGVAWGAISRRKIADRVQELHVSTNSRMDQLLELTRREAATSGVAQGRAEVHAEGERAAASIKDNAAQKAAIVLETAVDVARDKVKGTLP